MPNFASSLSKVDIQENDEEEETIGVKGLDDKASNDEHKTISH